MRKKILILFTLISSLALSNTRDLKMKMVLNKEDVNQILIDIVPEEWEATQRKEIIKEVKKEVSKSKEIKKVTPKKNIDKKKVILQKSTETKEELNSEDVKPKKELKTEKIEIPTKSEEKIIPVNTVTEKVKIEERKSNKFKLIGSSVIGALTLIFIKIIKKIKGGK